MCRHAGYIGPAIPIDGLTHHHPHGLLQQSYQAKELLTGSVCADGFGVAWYESDVRQSPGRYAYEKPIWADDSFANFAPLVASKTIIAAVRNATIAGENTTANCAPFVKDEVAFSHNGALDDLPLWQDFFAEHQLGSPRGQTDSEALLHCLQGPLHKAIASLCANVKAFAIANNLSAQLNMIASDGNRLIATRCGTDPVQNSLYHMQDAVEFPGGHVVASEPLYEDNWQEVAPDSMLILQEGAPAVRLPLGSQLFQSR